MLKSRQRRGYALHRMSLAIERILGGVSKEEKLQAVQWLGVWRARHSVFLAVQPACWQAGARSAATD